MKPGDKKGTPIAECPNDAVLDAAEEFHDAAKQLDTAQRPGGNAVFYNFTVASLVNAAFAAELYLKSLNSDHVVLDEPIEIDEHIRLYERDVPRKFGHRLLDLFRALDQYLRDYLEAEYLRAPVSTKFPTLELALAAFDNTFDEWRYLFESLEVEATPSSDILLGLLDFFRAAIKGKLPPKP